jgi:hemerythrin-like domain-containing protein
MMWGRDMSSKDESRRSVITSGLVAAAGILLTPSAVALPDKIDPEAGVTAPEDLMKEHGVLNRCLLIYEEGLRRLNDGQEVPPNVFHHTATLIRQFVEEYHEKNEEKYIFPVFEKRKTMVSLVSTLKSQHKAGRVVTARLIELSKPDRFKDASNREKLAENCHAFIRMYRPHEAREDTILFPALRTLLTAKQVEALGEKMEEDEQKVLGHEGFERSVAQVESIEKALGIYDLAQFTPR